MPTLADTETASIHAPLATKLVRRLLVVHAPVAGSVGRVHVLREDVCTLGRDPESGLALEGDGKVSRRHVRIEREDAGDGVFLCDLESRNGTSLNGRPVGRELLRDGDVIRIGDHLILFQELDARSVSLLLQGPRAVPTLVGQGHRMLRLLADIDRAGRSPQAALVIGETGAGKELVANALHARSERKGPLLAVNCGALSAELIESELFGHEAGSFTGAQRARRGLFEQAEGGSLFLDEIGEMPMATQVSLLRVLATGEVRPIGSARPRRVDTRVIAATNVDLPAAVEKKTFRADLHSRLLGCVVEVPPLRERREDILPLLETFLMRAGARVDLTANAAENLLVYGWPYNVRELEQIGIELAAEVSGSGTLHAGHLPQRVRCVADSEESDAHIQPDGGAELLDVGNGAKPTADELVKVLQHFNGNVSRVAAYFGKDRRQVYRWFREYEVKPWEARTDPSPAR